MEETEVIGTFDTEDTAREVSKALNQWFSWVFEGDQEEIPEIFEDFGVETEDYALDREIDTDWTEPPSARGHGNRVTVMVEAGTKTDLIEELLETLGAYEVTTAGEED